ncbi:hypothetical protein BJX63DRAFT_198525 [Aspergillus granulosus]|uniref:Uncharacterized protein n=1 Tax=Aspergillus granulosus TaxID=176169 RepID=A0ABR4GRB1_9EURO
MRLHLLPYTAPSELHQDQSACIPLSCIPANGKIAASLLHQNMFEMRGLELWLLGMIGAGFWIPASKRRSWMRMDVSADSIEF